MRVRSALVAPVLLAGVVAGAPPAAAGCPAVRTRGAWTLTDEPSFADVTVAGATSSDSDQTTHVAAWRESMAAPLGTPARQLVTNGVRLARTTDAGCTWRPVFETDTADPANLVAHLDPQYAVTAVAARRLAPGAKPVAGRDVAYVLYANTDAWTGLAQNEVGQPYVLARSTDGGATWHSDLLRATLPGVAQATPVIGNGWNQATALVAPADPRVGYLLLAAHDPRGVDPTASNTVDGGLYVTRDLGATWSYVTPFDAFATVVADPVDPAVLYAASNGHLLRVTVGATATTSAKLYDVPTGEFVTGVDTVRSPHGPARILVSAVAWDAKHQANVRRLHYSADGGRSWWHFVVSLPFAGTWDSSLVGGRAWLTASGDVVGVARILGVGAGATLTLRWDAHRRAWRRPVVVPLPMRPGWTSSGLMSVAPVDVGHRYFAVQGWSADTKNNGWTSVVGVWDSAR